MNSEHGLIRDGFLLGRSLLATLTVLILFTAITTATPSFYPNEGKIPLKVQFTLPGGDSCDSVKWDFGDGNSSAEVSPSYSYTKMSFFYPLCVCTLPGATVTYSFGKIVPENAVFKGVDETPQTPTDVKVDVKSDGLDLQGLIKQGTVFYNLGLYDYAATSYKSAIQKSGSDPQILAKYGDILAGLSRWEEAKNAYNQSLAIKQDKDVLNSYGGALVQLKQYDAALTAFNQSLAMEPSNSGAWAGTARADIGLKLVNESAAAFQKSLDIDASQPLVWKEYGDVLMKADRSTDAITAYEKAIAQGVSGADIYISYGGALRKAGRNAEAENAIAKGRSMQSKLYVSNIDGNVHCTAGGVMG
jgi:tetratricopeptide (TPR) repeat protein